MVSKDLALCLLRTSRCLVTLIKQTALEDMAMGQGDCVFFPFIFKNFVSVLCSIYSCLSLICQMVHRRGSSHG